MTAVPKSSLSSEEYLARERLAEIKSEYYDGEIFAMAGGSRAHSRIAVNVAGGLNAQDRPRVERYTRQGSGQWLLTVAAGLDSVVSLPSVECEMTLADIDRKVTFPEGAGRRP